MPKYVSSMTSTTFTMKVQLAATWSIDVTITGYGLKYDADTGAILAGEVQNFRLVSKVLVGTSWREADARTLMGVDTSAEDLAKALGSDFWNEAARVVDAFDKIATLHDGISTGFHSKTKNTVTTTEGSDWVSGYNYADRIEGLGGDDDILGGKGNDSLYGGEGDDVIDGGRNNDRIVDREGNNLLYGAADNDILIAGKGVDELDGGAGADILWGGGSIDRYTGGTGADQFVFDSKTAGRITITDFDASDVLVNISAGSGQEAYRMFLDHAQQRGRHVVYDDGELHLVLRNVKLALMDARDFADASGMPDLMQF